MLVFNEGVPRAGKSYDAVKNHILPALQNGRRVYARLNGLDHAAIAAYLKLPESRVRELLVHVETDAVKTMFRCDLAGGGRWVIPDALKNALIVIDEVHEFYVAGRQPLPPHEENFFALIGQNGGDVVIMTQWIKRVHPAVRARIERKNVFQKLTAVGKETKYRVTYYQTIAPDKYEKIGGSTEEYDPEIFPLYAGYAAGATNTTVYKSGGKTVWAMLLPKAVMFGIPAVVGAGFILWFFSQGGSALVDEGKQSLGTPAGVAVGQVWQPSSPTETPGQRGPAETWEQKQKREQAERLADLKPEQRYVMQLSERGRLRLAGKMGVGESVRVIVEWIDTEGRAVERLTGAALEALGVVVVPTDYGVLLQAGTESAVATGWPLTMVVRESESRLYRLDDTAGAIAPGEPPAAQALVSSRGTSGGRGGDGVDPVPQYGGFRH